MRSLRKIGIMLLALVLLPASIYVAYEASTLSRNEALMAEVYDRQMEAMLYSVNQYAWDVVGGWADDLGRQLRVEGLPGGVSFEAAVERFLEENPTVEAVFMTDSLLRPPTVFGRDEAGRPWEAASLPGGRELGQQLLAQKRAGYQKLEPLVLGEGAASTIALLFVPDQPQGSVPFPARLLGIALNAQQFITGELGPKLEEVSRGQFLMGLFREGVADPIYATGTLGWADVKQQRAVWLFPDYVLGIRFSGTSIEEVVRARFYRNLAVMVVLALVLLVGVWILYRNIRREVALAQMKSDFVSNVSHELRTPLSLIRMFAETLEMGRVRSDEQRQEYYRIIGQETERLTHLVNNILNFSRMEAGRKSYQIAPMAVNDVAEAVLGQYEYRFENEGFTVQLDLAEALPRVQGDAEAVQEALINLVDNALKYSGEARYLSIATGAAWGSVYIEVADQGIGITPAEQNLIFDKFYRVSTGLVHNTKGTGLGLTLVQHIMEAHGGKVSVESQPGEGSRFRLSFNTLESTPTPTLPKQTAHL